MFFRWYEEALIRDLKKPYIHLVFGARQTGKSTLINKVLAPDALRIDLSNPIEKRRYDADPGIFIKECLSLPPRGPTQIFIDEAPNVPELFDAVQHLYDKDHSRWAFILCGSSARRLRQTGTNLLPGRSFLHHLFPLVMAEHPAPESEISTHFPLVALPGGSLKKRKPLFPSWGIEERLAFGALPGIVRALPEDRARLLEAYAAIHLEEEIRRETAMKNWPAFIRFLELAALESGQIINFSTIAREAGLSVPTVKSHYQLLEDMFIGFQVFPSSESTRKNLLKSPRFFFFDLGIRNATAGIKPSLDIVPVEAGKLFEQWVGIELWKRLHYLGEGTLQYMRTTDGYEIDFILTLRQELIPIEVKWSTKPGPTDGKNIRKFLDEKGGKASRGFVVCRCPRPFLLEERITAIPWHAL